MTSKIKQCVAVVAVMLSAEVAQAQVDDWLLDDGWIDQNNPAIFQQKSEQAYSEFVDSINARFARVLEGKWQPFALQPSAECPSRPEPETPPLADTTFTSLSPRLLPSSRLVLPSPAHSKPKSKPNPVSLTAKLQLMKMPFHTHTALLNTPPTSVLESCQLPSIDENSVGKLWASLDKANLQSCTKSLLLNQQRMRLNDWAVYDLVSHFSAQLFPDPDRQVVATVFLMNQMEYDVKIARTDQGLACLLAISDVIYGVPYIEMQGHRYYAFMPNQTHRTLEGSIFTYPFSFENAHLSIGMAIAEVPLFSVVERACRSEVKQDTNGQMRVEMSGYRDLIDFYASYPQVELALYANAAVDEGFASTVDIIFGRMVEGKDAQSAVQLLLNYMHHGFHYATDQDQFGYEKPFFCEENFYYPSNDCEDRSILFSYLVRRLLGLEVVLVDYPGHVATAVCLPEAAMLGDYFMLESKPFVVCDPTYIGASVGMSQPTYRDEEATLIRLQPVARSESGKRRPDGGRVANPILAD